MNINLKIWRQSSDKKDGKLHDYRLENVDPNISFLEMLDILNNKLVKEKKDPVAFDHDCREGICGSCGFMINGRPHGPQKATTVCQLHMRSFKDEDDILLEPFRAKSFGVIKDLSVDRKSFDRIISSSIISQSKKTMQTKHSYRRHALVVVLALQHVKTHQPCFLLQQKYHT
jgi:succinate dehydrogenase / fumarate reductase iron-sulfur subunit